MSEILSKVPLLASPPFPPRHFDDFDFDVDDFVDVDVDDDDDDDVDFDVDVVDDVDVEECVANREILDKFVQ